MAIEQEKFGVDDRENGELKTRKMVKFDVKNGVIGAGARFLFYPTLLYNVLRYKIESDFKWWDQVDQVFRYSCS